MKKSRFHVVPWLMAAMIALPACSQSTPASQPAPSSQLAAPKETLNFPKNNINFIVPFNPGGSSDMIARALANTSQKYFSTTLSVINKPGGSTSIGLTEIITSKPDGYTIGTFNNGGVQLPLTSKTPYVYNEVMTPIAQVAAVPYVLVVNADAPWKTLDDLAKDIQVNPNKYTSGAAAAGGGTHFEMEKLALDVKSDIKSVIFNGGAPAIAALLGKNVDVSVQAPTEIKPHLQAGTLRVLAVFGDERMKDPLFKDIPTAKEQGYNILSPLWQGVGGPAKMDSQVVQFLEKAYAETLKDAEVIKAIENLGFEVKYLNSVDFKKKWTEEAAYFKEVFSSLGDRLK